MAIVGMNGREVAYRAWDKERGVMREVKEISWVTGSITVEPIKGTSEWWDLYDPILFEGMYELMQYTGLKDKNGVRICEGDIVEVSNIECPDSYVTDVCWGGEEYPAFDLNHKYIPNDWYYESNVLSTMIAIGIEEIKVVGNIYDNSELLKGCE